MHALLAQSRARNERRGITGLLLYGPRLYVQLLEGEYDTIQALYQRILADPRHHGLVKLADKAIAARSCPDWAMSGQPLLAPAAQLAGYRPLDTLVVPSPTQAGALVLESARQQLLAHLHPPTP